MDTLTYKTVSVNKANAGKEWIVVDATNQVLGRLTSEIAKILRGKHKPSFTPHADCGDNVIIINAEKVRLTGNKWADKEYIHYTGYPGGQRFATAKIILEKKPAFIIENAVKGMLPKNRLGRAVLKNLHVYAGADHPHAAQQPKEININTIK
ncbi:MAG: 50S ribosomal protein L13 [Bacteroidetes bacterium]|nr:50S ribosomal protein L13 [Bacteroidales bacterium]NJO70067.1 50S ribosomal protein L13 [Bacteroidota bacterium]